MSDRVIVKDVNFRDPETGAVVVYRAGDVPTEAHAKIITNPAAWGDATPEPSGQVRLNPAPLVAEQPIGFAVEEPAQDGDGDGGVSSLSYKELLALAKEKGLQFEKTPSKGEVLEALQGGDD